MIAERYYSVYLGEWMTRLVYGAKTSFSHLSLFLFAGMKNQCDVNGENESPFSISCTPRKISSRLVRYWNSIVYWLEKIHWFVRGIDFNQEENESSKTYRCSMYQAIPKKAFLQSLRSLDIDNNDVDFLDVGCGKGYSLYLAQKFGFRSISGIDNTQHFVETCIRNLKRLRTKNINVIFEDALNMKEKLDSYNVFYLFNPFPESTTITFIDDLKSSLIRKRRVSYLIYVAPCFFATIENAGFQRNKTLAIPMGGDYMYVFIYTLEQ